MTLFDIAKRNIKTNGKQYLLYFYPMVFSIVIYFTFVSIQYNEQIILSASTLGKIEPAFLASSILLLIFAAIFIWYSNSFFTKKRKKEVALYALFGMKKKQIGKLLFYENLIIGLIALIIGIGIGTLLTKFFIMIFASLTGFSMMIHFSFSLKAIVQTIIVFLAIILVTSIHNYRLVYRFSLLQLFKADKQGDRKPKATVTFAILSFICLGVGYTLILQPSDALIWSKFGFLVILGALISIIVGTYLFINMFVVFLLNKISQMKKLYYKGVNLISITHLLFRIKGNVLILTVISLLTTFTLFATGTTYSLYYNLQKILKETAPMSIVYTVPDLDKEKEISEIIYNSKHEILIEEKLEYLKIDGDLSETQRYPDEFPVLFLSHSNFERYAKKMGYELSINPGSFEAIAFNDGNLNQNVDPYTGKELTIEGKKIKIVSYEDYSFLNQYLFAVPLVVEDSLYEELSQHTEALSMQIYHITDQQESGDLVEKIQSVLFHSIGDMHPEIMYNQIFSTFYGEYQKGLETYGILIFISSFLGIIFLLATGSMLYYKQLTEALQDQQRYQVLRKLGMSSAQARSSIAKQLILIFLLPIVLAISNSSVIVTALANFTHLDMIVPFISTIIVYMIIYFTYYFLTLTKYHSLVNKG